MKKEIRNITRWALKQVDLYSHEAADLVFRTGLAETGYRHLKQMGGGPAIGFFQIEPATIKDTVENYLKFRPKLQNAIKKLGFIEKHSEYSLMSNIALQVVFCRLKYRRDKFPLPLIGDLRGQAEYWKRVYNTHLGKGTIEHFMEVNDAA